MKWLELQSSGPFITLKVSKVPLLLKWQVSFTDLHTSQECFFSPHGLDLPSASALGKTEQRKWFLILMSFLKPIIGMFVKTDIWATSGINKSCNSAIF